MSTTTVSPPACAGPHAVKPLPFDARGLSGLSERLIIAHHKNNYGGAVPASAWPLLAMEMYGHSYRMDHGAAALEYIDVFFANVNREAVERRYENARALCLALKDPK